MNVGTTPWITTSARKITKAELSGSRSLREMVDAYEKNVILIALAAAQGHQRRAARMLGLLPSTLNEKMRRFRIRATDQLDAGAVALNYRASEAALMMSAKTPDAVTSGPTPGPRTTRGDSE
jgi:Bacterial regulatory protein, Fis family